MAQLDAVQPIADTSDCTSTCSLGSSPEPPEASHSNHILCERLGPDPQSTPLDSNHALPGTSSLDPAPSEAPDTTHVLSKPLDSNPASVKVADSSNSLSRTSDNTRLPEVVNQCSSARSCDLANSVIEGEHVLLTGQCDLLNSAHCGSAPPLLPDETGVTSVVANASPQMAPLVNGARDAGVAHVQQTQPPDAGVAHVQQPPDAGVTHLQQVQLPDAGVAHLQQTPDAGVVHLQQVQLPDAGATHLQQVQLPDAGVAHVQQPPDAGVMQVQQPPDAGVAHVQQQPDAGVTHVQQTPNAGVAHVQQPPDAGGAHVQQTQPPDAGVTHLQQLQLPDDGGAHVQQPPDAGGAHVQQVQVSDTDVAQVQPPDAGVGHVQQPPDAGVAHVQQVQLPDAASDLRQLPALVGGDDRLPSAVGPQQAAATIEDADSDGGAEFPDGVRSGGAGGDRPAVLVVSTAASGDAGACSPLSELSDESLLIELPPVSSSSSSGSSVMALFNGEPPTAAAALFNGQPRSPGAVRLDVEAEARLINLSDRLATITEEKRMFQERLKREQSTVARLCDEAAREQAHAGALQLELAALRQARDSEQQSAAAQLSCAQQAARARELQLEQRLSRQQQVLEAAQRDKDRMVLRYAQSEKAGIDAKKEAVAADRRVKEAVKEKEMVASKVNHLVQERNRLSQQLEAKGMEARTSARDAAKTREDIESRDVRIKWLQNKMKQEADSYKEGQLRMDTLLRELRHAQETIQQYKLADDSRSTVLDRELREEKARRLVEEKLKQDSTHKERLLQSQLQQQQQRAAELAQQLAEQQERALSAESALEAAQSARDRFQQDVDVLKQQLDGLLHDSAELDEQRAVLQRERDRVAAGVAELAALQASHAELQADLDACHTKEADLLDFTQKLTEKNVTLQSELSAHQARALAADFESRQHGSRLSQLEAKLQEATARLTREQQTRHSDNQLLTRRLAERTRLLEDLTRRAEDAENETAIVRKKHQSSVRELQRELAAARRRGVWSESSPAQTPAATSPLPPPPASAADNLSHTSSSGSLAAAAAAEAHQQAAATAEAQQQTAAAAETQQLPQVQVMGEIPDRTALVERIVRLQRQVARRSEKIDFLQEHNAVLVEEVRRKSRLLQHYVLREETGAMTSQSMDQVKGDLVRRGGIMASIYGSQPKDTALTLELSLDINKKLQSVLEDTLLKNITLKDNMSVLGAEIAALTELNRKLKPKPPS